MAEEATYSDENPDNKTGHLPVDRGWAWVILAASWVNQFLVNGTFRTFGIIFPEIQRKFGASASTTSLISALNLICFGLSTILVQTIGLRYFSTRQTVMIGSLTMCVSYVISAFSPVVELLLLFQGAIPGIASALMFAPTSCLIGEYFDQKRGFALCISTTGGSVGLFAFSFLLRICLDEYGFTGTLLMTGAISLHGLVSGALQRPMNFYSRNITSHAKTVEDRTDDKNELDQVTNCHMSMRNNDKNTMSPLLTNYKSPSSIRASKRIRTYSQNSQGSLVIKLSSAINNGKYWRYPSNEFTSSTLDINAKTVDAEGNEAVIEERCRFQKFKTKWRIIISTDAIKRPVFLVFLPSGCLMAIACSLAMVFLPPHAKDMGLTDRQASLLITVVSIADMVSIPLWGIMADKRWIQSRNLVAIAATVMGVTMYFIPLFTTFTSLVFFSLVYGLFGRVWFSMYTLVLVEMLGLDNFKSALGILLLFMTATNSLFLYILGAMRDALGSYVPCYQLMATVLIAGAIGMLSLRLVEKCGKETKTKDKRVIVVNP